MSRIEIHKATDFNGVGAIRGGRAACEPEEMGTGMAAVPAGIDVLNTAIA